MFFTFLLLSRAEENATTIDSLIEEVKYSRAIVETLIEKLQNQKFQRQRRPDLYQIHRAIAQNQYNRAIMQNQYNRAIMQNQYNRFLNTVPRPKQGKQSRLPFKQATWRATEKLQLIHTDLARPQKTPSLRYFMIFIDDYSKMC